MFLLRINGMANSFGTPLDLGLEDNPITRPY